MTTSDEDRKVIAGHIQSVFWDGYDAGMQGVVKALELSAETLSRQTAVADNTLVPAELLLQVLRATLQTERHRIAQIRNAASDAARAPRAPKAACTCICVLNGKHALDCPHFEHDDVKVSGGPAQCTCTLTLHTQEAATTHAQGCPQFKGPTNA